MVVKTITVTQAAYNALKAKKEKNESFSKTILRIAEKRSLGEFFGVWSKETGIAVSTLTKNRSDNTSAEQRRQTLLWGK